MDYFYMNGILWKVFFVDPDSDLLVDRTGCKCVATTDPVTYCVYVSNVLKGDFLTHVLVHELGHCVMISYDLLDDIHRTVKKDYWIEAEEWICNFIADYGLKIFSIAYSLVGDDAWIFIPNELEKLVA